MAMMSLVKAGVMMRSIGITLMVALVMAPAFSQAQPTGSVPRIGIIANVRSPALEALQEGLRDLGYVDGQNIIMEWKLAEGKLERLPELAAELARLKVDVIVAPAPPYVNAARKVTTTIPIVFALVPDPVESGYVASLARPGGNLTGLANNAFELHAKRLQLLQEAIPNIKRLGVLRNPRTDDGLREVDRAAAQLGIQREVVSLTQAKDIDQAFLLMKSKQVDAVIEVGNSPIAYEHRDRIALLALQSGLPIMCSAKEFVEVGCLIYYGASFPDLMRRSAQYVHKILTGARPADIPVEQPTRFELVINQRTARALGVTIPSSLLMRADRVIE